MARTECTPCQTAQTQPSGLYQADCPQCKTRHLAKSLLYWQASQARRVTEPYKKALLSAFGQEWEAGHQHVKAEAQRLRAL